MKTLFKLIALASALSCFLPRMHAVAWAITIQQRDGSDINRARTIPGTPNTVIGIGQDQLPTAIATTGTGNVVKETGPTLINPNVTGNLTATGNVQGANLSGTNTGDRPAFENIIVSGQDTVTGNSTGNLTLAAGSGISITTNNTTKAVTITNTGGVGGNSTGNVIKGATFSAGQLLYVTNATSGEITGIPGATYNSGNNTLTFNGTLSAGALTPSALTGASGNGKLFIGSGSNFVEGDILAGPGVTAAPSAGNVTIGSTDARNFIVGNTTVTTNATGNFSIIAGDNISITADNAAKSITIDSTGGGSAETGDIKFILDSASVPSGWALTGANGIPAITSPDADAKAVIKMAGTVATPTFSPPAGAVASGTVITISSATSGVTFMTTNNTTDPSRSVGTAGGTWTINGNQTIESMGYKDGAYLIDSAVASAAYTIDPIPTLSSAVLQASGTDIVIGWPENVSYGAGGTGGYALTASGGAVSVTGVTGGGTTSHTLTTNRTITNAESVTLDYTNPGNGAEDSAFQDVVTFTGFTVNTSGGPSGGGGGITFDAATKSYESNVSSSFTHTQGSLTNGYVVVGVTTWTTNDVTNMTYDGVSMTKLAETAVGSGTYKACLWGLAVGSKSAGTYTVTYDCGFDSVAGATTYSGVNQSTPTGTAATLDSSTSTPSVTVSSATGEKVVALLRHVSGTATPDTGQTDRWTDSTAPSSMNAIFADQAGAASTTVTWTLSDTMTVHLAAIPLKPAP